MKVIFLNKIYTFLTFNIGITILFFLHFPFLSYSQNNISAFILSKTTQKAIPYATIGLLRENKGTTSDELGKFNLAIKHKDDSLMISAVGYKTSVFPVALLVNNMKIEIEENQDFLPTFVVTSKNSYANPVTLNEMNNCGNNYFTIDKNTYSQIAQHFEAPREQMRLTKIHICKMSEKSIFRVHVFDMDSISRKPLHDLLLRNFEVNNTNRNVEIDLKEYNIVLPQKDFFVSIEWLFVPENEIHKKTKLNNSMVSFTSYKPALSIRENKNNQEEVLKKFVDVAFQWQMVASFIIVQAKS